MLITSQPVQRADLGLNLTKVWAPIHYNLEREISHRREFSGYSEETAPALEDYTMGTRRKQSDKMVFPAENRFELAAFACDVFKSTGLLSIIYPANGHMILS